MRKTLNKISSSLAAGALLALLAAAPLPAGAGASFYGGTTNSPTFNRPTVELTALSGKVVKYSVQPFFTDANATCNIYGVQEGSFDGIVFLYRGAFDPTNPLVNLMAASDSGPLGPGSSALTSVALTANQSYYLVTAGGEVGSDGTFSNYVACSGATRVLAGDGTFPSYDGKYGEVVKGRFRISATWRDFQGHTGSGTFVPLGSDETGILWFFSPSNFELMIKVLNGCGLNNRYWVFFAALTNVEFHVTVLDTWTGVSKTYDNALGVSAAAQTDSNAFMTCP